jgi:hypothetical protein
LRAGTLVSSDALEGYDLESERDSLR